MDTRELPHDLEAERALLGAMLIDKNACNDVINMATPQDFYLDAHRLIFLLDVLVSYYKNQFRIGLTQRLEKSCS